VGLWLFFTRPAPFSLIRVPYGGLRTAIRSLVTQKPIKRFLKKEIPEEDIVNPVATVAIVEIIYPIVALLNKLEYVFGFCSPSPFFETLGWF